MSDISEIRRLLTFAQEFMQAAHSRVDDSSISSATAVWEREDRDEAVKTIERLDQEIENAAKNGKSADDIDRLTEDMGRKALRIADIFASAAQRILGAGDTFIFLPAEARTPETASSFAAHGAPALGALCRISLE